MLVGDYISLQRERERGGGGSANKPFLRLGLICPRHHLVCVRVLHLHFTHSGLWQVWMAAERIISPSRSFPLSLFTHHLSITQQTPADAARVCVCVCVCVQARVCVKSRGRAEELRLGFWGSLFKCYAFFVDFCMKRTFKLNVKVNALVLPP